MQFQFEQSNYTVSEAAGSLMVCIQLVSGNLSQPVNVTIWSQDGTATGRNHPVHKTIIEVHMQHNFHLIIY